MKYCALIVILLVSGAYAGLYSQCKSACKTSYVCLWKGDTPKKSCPISPTHCIDACTAGGNDYLSIIRSQWHTVRSSCKWTYMISSKGSKRKTSHPGCEKNALEWGDQMASKARQFQQCIPDCYKSYGHSRIDGNCIKYCVKSIKKPSNSIFDNDYLEVYRTLQRERFTECKDAVKYSGVPIAECMNDF